MPPIRVNLFHIMLAELRNLSISLVVDDILRDNQVDVVYLASLLIFKLKCFHIE